MEEEKSIDKLSLEEVLEQFNLTKNEGRKFPLKKLSLKVNEYLNAEKDKVPEDKLIIQNFRTLLRIDSTKAFELFNAIPLEKYKDDSIFKKFLTDHFRVLYKHEREKAIKLLDYISDKKLKNELIIDVLFIQILNQNKLQAFKLLDSISDEKRQDITVRYFRKILSVDKEKAFLLLNSIKNNQLREEIILRSLRTILKKDKEIGVSLLNLIQDKEVRDKAIFSTFRILFVQNKENAINLLISIENNVLRNEAIYNYFLQIFQDYADEAIELIELLKDKYLQEKLIIESFNIFYKNNISQAVNLFKLVPILEIKEDLFSKYKKEAIDNLSFGDDNLDRNLQKRAILKSYKNLYLKEDSILPEIGFIFNFLSKVENSESFKKLLEKIENEFIKANLKNNYEQFIEFIISLSNNPDTRKLKFFIKNKLKSYIEKKESKKVINEIIDNISDSLNKEELFIEEFTKQYNLNTLFRFIPEVAKRDSNLAISLLDRLEYLHHLSIEEIFLELYKSDFSKSLVYYNKLDDFYTKEKLSKQALSHHLPTFTNSFFYKSLSALDSHNIMNTLDELATIAPKEVLKYYGEIEDEDENVLDELLKKIVDLQNRAKKAEELNDEQLFEEILEEEKKLKIDIRVDEKLFVLFLDKYEMNNMKFMRLSLLDFEV